MITATVFPYNKMLSDVFNYKSVVWDNTILATFESLVSANYGSNTVITNDYYGAIDRSDIFARWFRAKYI